MKYYSILALVPILFFTACKDDAGETPTPANPFEIGEVPEINTSLVTNFSATYCAPCLNPGQEVSKDMIFSMGDKGYFIKMHPDGIYASVAVTNEATAFESNAWNLGVEAEEVPAGIRAWPTWTFNNDLLSLRNKKSYDVIRNYIGGATSQFSNAPCKANVAAKYTLDGKNLTLKYKLKAFQNLTGKHRLAFYVVENDQESNQWGDHGSGNESKPVVHAPLLIGSLNGTFGDKVVGDITGLAPGGILEGTHDFDLNDIDYDKAPRNDGGDYKDVNVAPNLDKLDIYAIIFDASGTNYRFVNVSKAERVSL